VGCSFGVHVVFSWRWDVRPSQDAPRVPSNFGKTAYLIDEIRLDDANYLQPNRGRFIIGHMACLDGVRHDIAFASVKYDARAVHNTL